MSEFDKKLLNPAGLYRVITAFFHLADLKMPIAKKWALIPPAQDHYRSVQGLRLKEPTISCIQRFGMGRRQNARAVPIVVNKALPGCREKRLPIPHPVTYLALQ